MKAKLAIASTAILVLAGAGAVQAAPTTNEPAQNGTSPTTSNPSMTAKHQRIEREIRQNLENAGFTDVHVVPESLLVRAKDKQGRPVMMVVNPDSVTELVGPASKSPGSANSANSANPTQKAQPKE